MSAPAAFSWFPPLLTVDDEQVVVAGQGCFVIFRYLAGGSAGSPHLATLCGPSGRNMVEDSPVDHLHHRGVWWGHGDINGVDYYLGLPVGAPLARPSPVGRGRIEHVGWQSIVDDAPRFGFVEELAWRDPSGTVVLAEQRSVLLHLVDGDHYTVDLDSTYTAQVEVAFGDTKEAALPGIRVAEVLTVAVGGTMINSRGQTGELGTFGQPAEWLDISGERSTIYMGMRAVEGIACLDHPDNPGHPNRWFTRGYGPVSPFPGHQFFDQRALGAGDQLRRRHRLVVHRGDAAGVAGVAGAGVAGAGVPGEYRRYCQGDG